jgi:hypothetical protein
MHGGGGLEAQVHQPPNKTFTPSAKTGEIPPIWICGRTFAGELHPSRGRLHAGVFNSLRGRFTSLLRGRSTPFGRRSIVLRGSSAIAIANLFDAPV